MTYLSINIKGSYFKNKNNENIKIFMFSIICAKGDKTTVHGNYNNLVNLKYVFVLLFYVCLTLVMF